MKTKIYTKGGDTGETSIIGGARVSKANLQLDAYGHIDELNASLGLTLSFLHDGNIQSSLNSLITSLIRTQNQLFTVGSQLACENMKTLVQMPKLDEDAIMQLENEIDQMTTELPELKNFILPGGHISASQLHIARTICRRAERAIVVFYTGLKDENHKMAIQFIIRYVNRLSDYLFVAARYINFQQKSEETKWTK